MDTLHTIKATGEPITLQVASISKTFWNQYLQSSTVAIESKWITSLDSFALEIFHRLYYDLEPIWKDPLQPENQWAQNLHNQLSETREFLKLAEQHNGNPLMSAIATHKLIQEVIKSLEQAHPQQRPVGDLTELRQQARQMQANGEDMLDITLQGQAIVLEAKQLAENIENGVKEIGQAIAQAQAEAQETEAMMVALGYGTGDGSEEVQVSAQERLAIAQKLASIPKLQEIAKMAGKALETAYRKRRQTQASNDYGELVGITVGNNLSQILPQELARLSQPQQKLSFFRDYLEGQLFQSELEAPQEKGRGDMIICVDESGSMNGINEQWAKGLCLALIQLAHKDQRIVSVIRFDHRAKDAIAIEPGKMESAIDYIAGQMLGGNTNFEAPIRKALSIIEENQKADLIFITDGIAPVSTKLESRVKEKLTETESNFFFLQIGGTIDSDLEAIADHAWKINPSDGFENISNIFVEIE